VRRHRISLVAALAVALSGCGSSRTLTRTVTRTSSTPAVTERQPTPTASSASDLRSFRTPSGNVGCVIGSGTARCDIRERSWTPPPRPSSCPLEWGQGLTVGEAGSAAFVCAGDTALDPSSPVLAYGRSSTLGDLTCQSLTAGVRCANARTGHGFTLARERYSLF
jgi:hypothetical protein